MSTRSMIAVMHGDKAKAVYCHWDGYVAHNGAILQEHYDSVKANKLVSMGDLSSLRANIGEKHAFSDLDLCEADREAYEAQHGNSCTFYGRDRGEEGTEYTTFQTLADLLSAAEGRWCEYVYIMREGVWYYSRRTVVENGDSYLNLWTPLEFVSAALMIEEAV